MRPILNLKRFNESITHIYFKVEELKTVRRWFCEGHMCILINLKHGFMHVPIIPWVKKFLRFKWKGIL